MISRSNSSHIGSDDQGELLQSFGITEAAFIGKGTETRVYDLDGATVLKMYPAATHRLMINTLRDFYDSLDSSALSFQVPRILEIRESGNLIGVVEKKISGVPLSSLISDYLALDFQQLYIEKTSELKNIKILKPLGRFMLFDSQHLSSSESQDWHGFLRRLITQKLPAVTPDLELDVTQFAARSSQLLNFFSGAYAGDLRVIHGDVYTDNILIEPPQKVTGIIDFGTFTMIGDPLFDVATAWGFFGMYEPNHVQIRDSLLEEVIRVHGESCRLTVYRYLLTYAILSCDLYPEEQRSIRHTGHYQWAVEVLTDERYWASPH